MAESAQKSDNVTLFFTDKDFVGVVEAKAAKGILKTVRLRNNVYIQLKLNNIKHRFDIVFQYCQAPFQQINAITYPYGEIITFRNRFVKEISKKI